MSEISSNNRVMKNETYTDAEMVRYSLNDIGLKHKTDKSTITHHYLGNYEAHLSKWRDDEFTILEIGVAGGASIAMWREYFPKAKVYGVDNNPACAGDGIFMGDHNDKAFMDSVMAKIGKCRLIIDDGSHVGHDMKRLFDWLFVHHVESGGLYVVEDTHCLYSDHYNQGSDAFQFFTSLARDIDVGGKGMCGNQDFCINHPSPDLVPMFSRYLRVMHIYTSLWMFERK